MGLSAFDELFNYRYEINLTSVWVHDVSLLGVAVPLSVPYRSVYSACCMAVD